MIEELIQKYVYKLDFIDLNILEQLTLSEGFLAFPNLVKKLKRLNVWNRGILTRRIRRLRELKIIHFEDGTYPIVLEFYRHDEKKIKYLTELLKRRLIVVK